MQLDNNYIYTAQLGVVYSQTNVNYYADSVSISYIHSLCTRVIHKLCPKFFVCVDRPDESIEYYVVAY